MYQTKKKWNFLCQTNIIQFNFVDRCPRHRNQRQDDGMSSLELVLQSVQGARRTESTKHRENSTVPDHFRVTVQQGNWLRNHRGFYLDQQWMQWNLQSGILYRYCFELQTQKSCKELGKMSHVLFSSQGLIWSEIFLSLNQLICKNVTCFILQKQNRSLFKTFQKSDMISFRVL